MRQLCYWTLKDNRDRWSMALFYRIERRSSGVALAEKSLQRVASGFRCVFTIWRGKAAGRLP